MIKMKSFITFAFITILSALAFSQTTERKFVSVNNKQMAYTTFGLQDRKINDPIVVFESGLGSGGGGYGSMFPFITTVSVNTFGRKRLGNFSQFFSRVCSSIMLRDGIPVLFS